MASIECAILGYDATTYLRHLIELLANDLHNPPLGAGEIISTGMLTLAMPVKSGERWTTTVLGIPLEEITIRFG